MSMHWAALLTDAGSDSSLPIDPIGVAVWALQFTPRVAQKDQPISALPHYAELRRLSNFSFLRGASKPEELVKRANELG
jgi:hypothetical protein